MLLNLQPPRDSLNKAFLKTRPNRSQIELFKKNILILLDNINNNEGEEHNKNIVSEFLKNTWYSPNHYINTKERADLVIHSGKDSGSPVGVLFEVKNTDNRHEMPTKTNLNSKAFHELILYYMRERIRDGNIKIRHLIITNIYEWFIFESADFERLFANNKKLVEDFREFEEKRGLDTVTDFFYKGIADPFIKNLDSQITFTYFDIRDFEKIIRNVDKQDDKNLIVLYKIFSPEHLLKLPFTNDSNTLDKSFYTELLHIIGLEESKAGSKKIIGRKPEERRNSGSLIENTLNILKSEDCLSQLKKKSDFGASAEEQYYNLALELAITWINRILFLKLLEGQLIRYNGGDKTFSFLKSERIEDFDELNKLFFRVLAIKEDDRSDDIRKKYSGIPFLNSSLFEPTDIERSTLRISSLDDSVKLPVLTSTVLKDRSGRRLTGSMNPLEYLFSFLDSYDFSSEGSEDIQEENKTLINASVLGLIFEKINGYKDGSFFTPGFITMYMCHETITRAVVQKFNEIKGWNCETITDIYNKNPEIAEANRIVNSLKICDPAVGSGHFLVSALNEIIAIKSELGILADKGGKLLRDYTIEVINDELVITDAEGRFFEYNPKNKESQRVQETLFREKQIIIENCLFGVDINPNSVKICRLRLWIELLKNAYYKDGKSCCSPHLETLPNIDINIKCGNSLISRYSLDADIRTALRSSKWTVDNYREAVMTYRNAQSKEEKRSMEDLITKIKTDFETEVAHNDKRFLKLNKLKGEMMSLSGQTTMFELSKKEKEEWNKKLSRLSADIKKVEDELSEIKNNKIFENAFEWRFEFPEVLNNDGDFVGFDVVIGNPPYGIKFSTVEKKYLKDNFKTTVGKYESYGYFIEKGLEILRLKGLQSFITPHTWLTIIEAEKLKILLLSNSVLLEILKLPSKVFEDAVVETITFIIKKTEYNQTNSNNKIRIKLYDCEQEFRHDQNIWLNNIHLNILVSPVRQNILLKCKSLTTAFSDFCDFSVGVQAYDQYCRQSPEIIKSRLYHSNIKRDESFIKELNGKDVFRYHYVWPGNTWISYGEWLAHPRQKKFFDHERILVREITSNGRYSILASYADEFLINYKSILNIILKDESKEKGYNINFFLGVLNSSLFSWLFNISSNKIVTDTFPRISILDIKRFPIKEINFQSSWSKALHDTIVESVKQINKSKLENYNADTSHLELMIDKQVYDLYELTEEEIRIVEGSNSIN